MTKPMIMTVVAPEDWIMAVERAPMPTPASLLPDTLENIRFRLSELRVSRLELMMPQAVMKTPTPARS